jgi:lysophospholipase
MLEQQHRPCDRSRGAEPLALETGVLTITSDTNDVRLVPKGAIVAMIVARDGVKLRAARWTAPAPSAGTVAIIEGRAEFVEKYCEVVAELTERGFDVVVLDWRGQGLSDRLLRNRRKGHVSSFRAYRTDLEALRDQILEPFCPKPWFALGHSMGGAILLDQAHDGDSPFERMVLTAPMIDLRGLRFPKFTHRLTHFLAGIGFRRTFIPGGSGKSYMLKSFEGNLLTSDPVRYARTAAFVETNPDLVIGDPTIGWVSAAFYLMQRFEKLSYPLEIPTPILVLTAGHDRLVHTGAAETFASRLKCGRSLTISGSSHEILMERERFRELFWAAFDSFIPGETKTDAAPFRAAQGPIAAGENPR